MLPWRCVTIVIVVVMIPSLLIEEVNTVETKVNGNDKGGSVPELKVSLKEANVANDKDHVNDKHNDGLNIKIVKDDKTKNVADDNTATTIINKNMENINNGKKMKEEVTTREEDDKGGAVRRGFYVTFGLSAIVIVYFFIKWYRVKSKKYQPPLLVRKYGVKANRSDVEMVPLPLSDDEDDDDTVFEVNRTER